MHQTDFQRPRTWPALATGEVHVWLMELDRPPLAPARLSTTLSADERQRAARFHNPHTGERYATLHQQLRRLLAHYTGIPAAALQFTVGKQGKPLLRQQPLHFNSSRSSQLGLVAICADAEVGVDIEHHQPAIDHPQIARHYFSSAERAALAALPASRQLSAFHQIWTRKEAYLKALGVGLTRSLDGFSVCRAGKLLPARIDDHSDASAQARWQLHDLLIAPDFSATLATSTASSRRRCLLMDRA